MNPQRANKMKKLLVNFFCVSVLLLASGCEPKTPTPEVAKLEGNVSSPAWSNPTDYDYSSSMTAVIKVDLLADYPEAAKEWKISAEDKLAAFMGDVCCGVASPEDELFYLYITEPENTQVSNVTLRYYSAFYKNIFEAKDAFVFQNDTHKGLINEPFVPKFTIVQ